MKKRQLTYILLLLLNSGYGQMFNTKFATPASTATVILRDIEPVEDGKLLASIEYADFGTNWGAGLMKMDNIGNVIWVKAFNVADPAWGNAFDVVVNEAGNYYFFASNNEGLENDFYARLMEISPDGDILWMKQYHLGDSFDIAYSKVYGMKLLDSGDIQLVMYSETELIILKTTSTGELIWGKKTANVTIGPDHSGFEWAPIGEDGGIFTFKANDDIMNTARIDGDGNLLWSNAYSVGNFPIPKTIIELTDGNYLLGGYSGTEDSTTFIWKMTPSGTILWAKEIEGYSAYDRSRMHFSKYEDHILLDLSGIGPRFIYLELDETGEILNGMQLVPEKDLLSFAKIEFISTTEIYLYGNYRIDDVNYGFLERTSTPFDETCLMEPLTYSTSDFLDYEAVDYTPIFTNFIADADHETTFQDAEVTQSVICLTSGLTQSKILDFDAYPNPTTGSISLDLPAEILSSAFKIQDITGKVVIQGTVNTQKVQINLTDLSPGHYFITIQHVDQQLTKQFTLLR